jgi:hypothetical protein
MRQICRLRVCNGPIAQAAFPSCQYLASPRELLKLISAEIVLSVLGKYSQLESEPDLLDVWAQM